MCCLVVVGGVRVVVVVVVVVGVGGVVVVRGVSPLCHDVDAGEDPPRVAGGDLDAHDRRAGQQADLHT